MALLIAVATLEYFCYSTVDEEKESSNDKAAWSEKSKFSDIDVSIWKSTI